MATELLNKVELKLQYENSSRKIASITEDADANKIKAFADNYNRLQDEPYKKIIRTAKYELLNF